VDKAQLDALTAQAGSRSLNSAIFNMARAYSETGDLAEAAMGRSKNADFAGPLIMCKSFSVEMLLKFFIIIEHPTAKTMVDLEKLGVDLRGHVYSKLFDRISASRRRNIGASFSKLSSKTTDEAGFRDILKTKLGDDPFVFWRYIYEKSGTHHCDLQTLKMVVHALGEAAAAERQLVEPKKPAT